MISIIMISVSSIMIVSVSIKQLFRVKPIICVDMVSVNRLIVVMVSVVAHKIGI